MSDLNKPMNRSQSLVKNGMFDVDSLTKGDRGSQQFADMVSASKSLNDLHVRFKKIYLAKKMRERKAALEALKKLHAEKGMEDPEIMKAKQKTGPEGPSPVR